MKTILNAIALLITLQAMGQGSGWQLQNSGTTEILSSVHFSDTLHGWVVGFQKIVRTQNGGQTWESVPLQGLVYPADVFFPILRWDGW